MDGELELDPDGPISGTTPLGLLHLILIWVTTPLFPKQFEAKGANLPEQEDVSGGVAHLRFLNYYFINSAQRLLEVRRRREEPWNLLFLTSVVSLIIIFQNHSKESR